MDKKKFTLYLAFGSLVFANEFLAVVKDSKIENLMRSLQSEKNDKKKLNNLFITVSSNVFLKLIFYYQIYMIEHNFCHQPSWCQTTFRLE